MQQLIFQLCSSAAPMRNSGLPSQIFTYFATRILESIQCLEKFSQFYPTAKMTEIALR